MNNNNRLSVIIYQNNKMKDGLITKDYIGYMIARRFMDLLTEKLLNSPVITSESLESGTTETRQELFVFTAVELREFIAKIQKSNAKRLPLIF